MPKLSGIKAFAVNATLITVALFLAFGWTLFLGCGDNLRPPPTFGEGASQVSEAFCERRYECGFDEPTVEECVAFNEESLCERWDCAKELTPDQSDIFDACTAAFSTWQCGPFLPASCYDALEQR